MTTARRNIGSRSHTQRGLTPTIRRDPIADQGRRKEPVSAMAANAAVRAVPLGSAPEPPPAKPY